MHDIKWIVENAAAFDAACARRGLGSLAGGIVALDEARRAAVQKLQVAQERRNAASREIGQAMGRKDMATAEALKAEVAQIKQDFPAFEAQERESSAALEKALAEIPNLPLAEVPDGVDENDNVETARHGAAPSFPAGFKPREHFEIGEALGMMDFDAAAKMSGARFVVLRGQLARMQRALGQFMLDLQTQDHGYTEVAPPLLVRDHAMYGTGQLPKFYDDLFFSANSKSRDELMSEALSRVSPEMATAWRNAGVSLTDAVSKALEAAPSKEDLWLIPTAEVSLTNLVREAILDEAALPHRYTALTPCFRAEAGSAGRDTRGMIRQHQFEKVELVSITRPEDSLAEHERMTASAEEVLKRLGLHYRKMLLCTGDMGFAAQKTHDIEVWLPGQDRYREISSVSVCGDFQARRMDARTKAGGEKGTRFVHTLNGSGLAVGRTLVALMENYQDEGGRIAIPQALHPYLPGLTHIGGPA